MPLRRFLLVLLFFGLAVTGADLMLLEHYEDRWQLLPLGLIAAGLVAGGAHAFGRGAGSLKVLRLLMVFYLFAGLIGLGLHYRGSRAFQVEVNPGLEGLELFWRAVRAKAPPALAPSAMIHLGLLGLAYSFRHPVLSGSPDDTEQRSTI